MPPGLCRPPGRAERNRSLQRSFKLRLGRSTARSHKVRHTGRDGQSRTNPAPLRNIAIPAGTETICSYNFSQKPFAKGR